VRPDYRLIANSTDITATIRDRLIDLRLTDAAGIDSDVLEINLADHLTNAPIAMPETGAELELFLGYDGASTRMGFFVVDEIELTGWPSRMTVRARAAIYDKASKGGKTNLQTSKTRNWPKDTTIKSMVDKIASEHGMEGRVSQSLASVKLPATAQVDESDLNLLSRIGKKFDAVVKPSGGMIVFAKRGEAKTVGGEDLPDVSLVPGDVTSYRVTFAKRDKVGTVVAYYHQTSKAKRLSVKVGTGEPTRRLKMYHPNQDMAKAAALAEWNRMQRRAGKLTLQLPGRPDLQAEGKITLAGFRDGVDGEWIATAVEHQLSTSGYICSVEAETAPDGTEPDIQELQPEQDKEYSFDDTGLPT
jgi:uncharacterized protein